MPGLNDILVEFGIEGAAASSVVVKKNFRSDSPPAL